jgi:hypothetical protein
MNIIILSIESEEGCVVQTVFFIIFLALMTYLIASFIRDMMNKRNPNKEEKPSVHSWIIPAIIASLVAHGLVSKEESSELEGLSFAEVEEYLVNHDIFDSSEEMEEWLLNQPEIVGSGDSIFGSLDSF